MIAYTDVALVKLHDAVIQRELSKETQSPLAHFLHEVIDYLPANVYAVPQPEGREDVGVHFKYIPYQVHDLDRRTYAEGNLWR